MTVHKNDVLDKLFFAVSVCEQAEHLGRLTISILRLIIIDAIQMLEQAQTPQVETLVRPVSEFRKY